ncbi:unnamed protein product, partial [Amoebophrya sp. A120]
AGGIPGARGQHQCGHGAVHPLHCAAGGRLCHLQSRGHIGSVPRPGCCLFRRRGDGGLPAPAVRIPVRDLRPRARWFRRIKIVNDGASGFGDQALTVCGFHLFLARAEPLSPHPGEMLDPWQSKMLTASGRGADVYPGGTGALDPYHEVAFEGPLNRQYGDYSPRRHDYHLTKTNAYGLGMQWIRYQHIPVHTVTAASEMGWWKVVFPDNIPRYVAAIVLFNRAEDAGSYWSRQNHLSIALFTLLHRDRVPFTRGDHFLAAWPYGDEYGGNTG